METMNLELMALKWLIFDRRCEIALCQRSPRSYHCGQPDVLGVTKDRFTIEIEIKRSVSDFRADQNKQSRNEIFRSAMVDEFPRQFYYFVPRELVTKVEPLLPEWAGLMRGPTKDYPEISIAKVAPVNRKSKRLSVKECFRLVKLVNYHAISCLKTKQACYDRFQEGAWSWPEPDYEI